MAETAVVLKENTVTQYMSDVDTSTILNIVKEYKGGSPLFAVVEKYNISWNCAKDILRHNNVYIRSEQPAWEKEVKRRMDAEGLQRYLNGEAAGSIAKDLRLTNVAILKYLRRNNVAIRNFAECHDSHRCEIDHTVFDTITEESMYYTGFLLGDGHIRKSKYADEIQVTLCLAEKDLEIIEKFKKFLKATYEIGDTSSTKNGKTSKLKRISFQSKQIGAALKRYGVDEGKSHRGPEEIIAHDLNFWRGMIDSDGHIATKATVGYNRIGLCGNIPTLEKYCNFVQNDLKLVTSEIRPNGNSKDNYFVNVNGINAIALAKELWGNATIYLQRKYPRVQSLINDGGTLPIAGDIVNIAYNDCVPAV